MPRIVQVPISKARSLQIRDASWKEPDTELIYGDVVVVHLARRECAGSRHDVTCRARLQVEKSFCRSNSSTSPPPCVGQCISSVPCSESQCRQL